DLAQETLLRAYIAFCEGRFEEGTNAQAWMLRIMTNLFIDEYHRRKRRESVGLDSLTAGGERVPESLRVPSEELPDVALLEAVLDEPLECALASLTPPLRACVILVYVEGMEYVEAARALGIPVGTVRSRLARARLQLYERLYDYARERQKV
ncbi:MAG TPA: sigma-70 family RNA polymerase sigma factor, partial [Chthonomonadaceae bacterium]|nr:sigma-70 family RNA polymerase sigma factor [Chthonomonadaceae bacterium]